MKDKYLRLYSCCILTKGFLRSIIIDTQRQDIYFIPNELYEILTSKVMSLSVDQIKANYDNQDLHILVEYFDFLISKEIAFYTEEPYSFPEISLDFKIPGKLTNVIIDIDRDSNYDLETTIKEINDVGIDALQIRVFDAASLTLLNSIFNFLNSTQQINSVEFIVGYNEKVHRKDYENLIKRCILVSRMIVYSSPFHDEIKLKIGTTLFYTTSRVENETSCGNISPYYFVTNTKAVTEGRRFNSCLNKKLSIDKTGRIKNCPSMSSSFGKIGIVRIDDVIKKEEFKTLWKITKDQIDVCRDCEFRMICTDCRAYLTNPNNPYSKPLKCTYNPYSAKWEE